jgi:transposase
MDTDMMTKHMLQISEATECGRHALVIVDGASWHNEKATEDIENVSILKLPPYSPELNPIEQVWQWMRQNELASVNKNRQFKFYRYLMRLPKSSINEIIPNNQI